jgi:hypothetical protein
VAVLGRGRLRARHGSTWSAAGAPHTRPVPHPLPSHGPRGVDRVQSTPGMPTQPPGGGPGAKPRRAGSGDCTPRRRGTGEVVRAFRDRCQRNHGWGFGKRSMPTQPRVGGPGGEAPPGGVWWMRPLQSQMGAEDVNRNRRRESGGAVRICAHAPARCNRRNSGCTARQEPGRPTGAHRPAPAT